MQSLMAVPCFRMRIIQNASQLAYARLHIGRTLQGPSRGQLIRLMSLAAADLAKQTVPAWRAVAPASAIAGSVRHITTAADAGSRSAGASGAEAADHEDARRHVLDEHWRLDKWQQDTLHLRCGAGMHTRQVGNLQDGALPQAAAGVLVQEPGAVWHPHKRLDQAAEYVWVEKSKEGKHIEWQERLALWAQHRRHLGRTLQISRWLSRDVLQRDYHTVFKATNPLLYRAFVTEQGVYAAEATQHFMRNHANQTAMLVVAWHTKARWSSTCVQHTVIP
ncbi:hypothetical protein JKP88DRAFT_242067 [Tribonema minus]|uniref:Uncharacterized protein n=1 Tax=Tribonema minus TaxID=303371 RepID=A0A835YLC0_9STRA|nr:hypothetical protein JKP88DRAFT_242067 [Tribonema minus]